MSSGADLYVDAGGKVSFLTDPRRPWRRLAKRLPFTKMLHAMRVPAKNHHASLEVVVELAHRALAQRGEGDDDGATR
jgi:hypothetical protein